MSGTGPTLAVVATVRDRDAHSCVRCGRGGALTTQHRVSRGMGGSRHRPWVNQPSNLLSLCGSGATGCHGWVEHHPTEARLNGWALSRFIEHPEDHPVLYPDRGWYYLTSEGGKVAVGGFAGGCGGGWGVPVDHQDVGAALPGPDAVPRPGAAPFPV